MVSVQQVDERLLIVLVEPQLADGPQPARRVEDSHHHALALHGGHDRDAQIDHVALIDDTRPPVLRQTPLSDVHAADDLDAAYNRGQQALAETTDQDQAAVDPEQQLDLVLLRPNVDIGGLAAYGIQHHPVDQSHDGFLAGQALGLAALALAVLVGGCVRGLELFDRGFADLARIEAFDRALDLLAGRDRVLDGMAGEKAQNIDRLDVARVIHGHHEPTPIGQQR